ncbi:MAG: RNA polymerase sigma factor [Ardenticatenaceae bacterium]
MINLCQLSLNAVIQGYDEELKRRREDEVGYGFEVFRRAIEEQNELAWEALYERHCGLIYSWIQMMSSDQLAKQEYEDLMQESWVKFYRNMIKCSVPLSNQFQHVGSLFNYLKKCVLTVIRDHQRRLIKDSKLQKQLQIDRQDVYSAPDMLVLNGLLRQAQRQAVKEWMSKNVTDPEELLVICCSYEQGLAPREIVRCYPDHFHNVKKVYRVKERVLKRAKRCFESIVL